MLIVTMIINGFLYNKFVCIIPKEKLENKFRIIFVGDSITEGTGTSKKSKSYPLLLKSILKQKYPKVDIIKNGAGWRTAQKHGDRPCVKDLDCLELSILQEPDVIVLMFGSNDSKNYQWMEEAFEEDYYELCTNFRRSPTHPLVYLVIPPPLYIN